MLILLNDEEWAEWSDVEIAERCRVHHSTVADYRKSLAETESDNLPPTTRTYTDKHGNVSTMNTENIGRAYGLRRPKTGQSDPSHGAARARVGVVTG